jgi:hypothetical protein
MRGYIPRRLHAVEVVHGDAGVVASPAMRVRALAIALPRVLAVGVQ